MLFDDGKSHWRCDGDGMALSVPQSLRLYLGQVFGCYILWYPTPPYLLFRSNCFRNKVWANQTPTAKVWLEAWVLLKAVVWISGSRAVFSAAVFKCRLSEDFVRAWGKFLSWMNYDREGDEQREVICSGHPIIMLEYFHTYAGPEQFPSRLRRHAVSTVTESLMMMVGHFLFLLWVLMSLGLAADLDGAFVFCTEFVHEESLIADPWIWSLNVLCTSMMAVVMAEIKRCACVTVALPLRLSRSRLSESTGQRGGRCSSSDMLTY